MEPNEPSGPALPLSPQSHLLFSRSNKILVLTAVLTLVLTVVNNCDSLKGLAVESGVRNINEERDKWKCTGGETAGENYRSNINRLQGLQCREDREDREGPTGG